VNPSDIIAEWQECPALPQKQIDRLLAAGVSEDALAFDPDDYGFAIAADRVAFDGPHFAFERHMRQPDDTCASALIFIARDECGDPADLVAWRGGQLASWTTKARLLGQQHVFGPRVGSPALAIHQSPLEWLRADRHGCVLIDTARARWLLGNAGPLQASSIAHGRALLSALTFSPEILVPASQERLAA
jgi:hypothetical protein